MNANNEEKSTRGRFLGKFRSSARRNKPPVASPTFPKQVAHLVCAVAIALGTYLLATRYVFGTVVVDGESMNPTLHDTERFMLNKVEYYFREPQAGDIVVIRDPEDGGLSVKRIVATNGESIEIADGSVYVNSRKLREPYLAPGTRTYSNLPAKQNITRCGADEFFVLGDNRGNSADSREYGAVPRRNILGVVVP